MSALVQPFLTRHCEREKRTLLLHLILTLKSIPLWSVMALSSSVADDEPTVPYTVPSIQNQGSVDTPIWSCLTVTTDTPVVTRLVACRPIIIRTR